MKIKINTRLPFRDYLKCHMDEPYWLYCLGNNIDKTKLVVFKDKLWYTTNYVVPIVDGAALSVKEAANPINKPVLATILIRQPQSQDALMFEYSTQHTPDDPIFVGIDDIPIEKELKTTFSEYLKATERWLMEAHYYHDRY